MAPVREGEMVGGSRKVERPCLYPNPALAGTGSKYVCTWGIRTLTLVIEREHCNRFDQRGVDRCSLKYFF